MMGVGAFAAYASGVPAMGRHCGGPSYVAVKCAAARVTVAVCGMLLAITASCACGVPGTEASTTPLAPPSGIFAKSGGSWPPGTYSQGPSVDRARNQRPEISTYVYCVFSSRKTCACVLVA